MNRLVPVDTPSVALCGLPPQYPGVTYLADSDVIVELAHHVDRNDFLSADDIYFDLPLGARIAN